MFCAQFTAWRGRIIKTQTEAPQRRTCTETDFTEERCAVIGLSCSFFTKMMLPYSDLFNMLTALASSHWGFCFLSEREEEKKYLERLREKGMYKFNWFLC